MSAALLLPPPEPEISHEAFVAQWEGYARIFSESLRSTYDIPADLVDEMLQEIRIRLMSVSQHLRHDPASPYIKRTIKNAAYTYLSTHRRDAGRYSALIDNEDDDTDQDARQASTEAAYEQTEQQMILTRCLGELSPVQKQIIEMHFGLAGQPPQGVHRIARSLPGMSSERIQREIEAAMARMRRVTAKKS